MDLLAKFKVIVDRVKCIGCGVAPSICPEIFLLDSRDLKNRVINKYSTKTDESISIGIIPEELYECAKSAAGACPVGAITVEKE
ncbi:MAG: ferredoxin [Desulfurococcaceae archaeon]